MKADVAQVIARCEHEASVVRRYGREALPDSDKPLFLDYADADFQQKIFEQLVYVAWLRNLPYSEYLRTEHWQERRRAALERYGYECWRCNKRTDLQVHHLTYAFRGMESTEELMVLCGDCHKKEHGL